ncbi:uncharacterized protein BDZ99DRAFT_374896 [Mytilinidion resinicola]|uniref:MYND-type domain-containing protein n=1 Tax=Mytilinidion resinicola TaxID=574789 RepID=A0A6A6Z8H4_9PEZI|nr:uncharacterized protein BDZ99DRAFT_374896 [Mytilinidion resinicola]KAF2817108.1 hypothetical protein BDZ99DRAFT_374896 [Mytilinidion resinicola]
MATRMANREQLMQRDQVLVPSLPTLAIKGHLCFRCCKSAEKLSKCGACKRAVYCSKGCQVSDWKIAHKNHCKLLKEINVIEEKETAPNRSWDLYRDSLYSKLQWLKSTQDVPPAVQDMIQAQVYCVVCHRSEANTGWSKFASCPSCLRVSTCQTCPAKNSHSEKVCKDNQLFNQLERFLIDCFEHTGEATPAQPTLKPRSTYEPLSIHDSWEKYYKDLSDGAIIDEITTTPGFSLLKPLAPDFEDSVPERIRLHHILGTDVMTMPITILAALEDTIPDLAKKTSLFLHFVGPTSREWRNIALFEELLHLLPALKSLRILCAGPSSYGLIGEDILSQEMDLKCCPDCQKAGRKRSMQSFRGMYHDFVQRAEFSKPDMAVLFHSGRTQAEQSSWAPTTKALLDLGTLTLCTTFNEREAKEEVAELDGFGANVIARLEVNTWRGLMPTPDFLEGPEHGFFYMNYFRYIFQGRK